MSIVFFMFNPCILVTKEEIKGEIKIESNAPAPETIPISVLDNPLYCKKIAIYPYIDK